MNKKTFAKIAAFAMATTFALLPALSASATSKVTVDLPNAAVAGGTVTPVPVTLSGFAFANLSISVAADSGTLTLNDGSSLATLNPGFTSLADQTEISFHAAAADAVTLLASGLAWTAPGASTDATQLKLRIQVSEFVAGQTYDPATGHSYKYVDTPTTWADARAAAKLMTYLGHSGYLTNITTSEENDFVANKSGASDIWFGATDDQTQVAITNTAKGLPAYTGDPQVDGHMIWADGPEAGTVISNGLDTQVVLGPLGYAGWANGEPNNWSAIEGCGLTNWNGDAGKWNDFECATTKSYLVEFDTTASQFDAAAVTFDNITGNDVDAVPAAPTSLANTGASQSEFAGLIAAGIALAGAGVVVTRARRKQSN